MDIKDTLRNRQLKATTTRVRLLELMHQNSNALSLHDLQKGMPNCDRTTLYRTLQSLIEHGLIHLAGQHEQLAYYALCPHHCDTETHVHHHAHFRCRSCKSVSCVPIDNWQAKWEGLVVEQVDVQLEGLCDNCH